MTEQSPSGGDSETKPKKRGKMTAEKRKKLAEERRKRILARGEAGQKYIQKQLTKEELKKTESENLENINEILTQSEARNDNIDRKEILNHIDEFIDPHSHFNPDLRSEDVPIHRNGPLSDPFSDPFSDPLSNPFSQLLNSMNDASMGNIGNIGGIGSMGSMGSFGDLSGFSNLGNMGNMGSMGNCFQENKIEQEHNDFIENREKNIHLICSLLFVLILILMPDIDILGYNLETDTFTFFLSYQVILISIFLTYKYHRRYIQQNANNDSAFGNPLLDSIVSQFLGNGFLSKMINRFKFAQDVWKTMKLFVSDFCLILFVWVTINTIMSYSV